MIFQCAPLRLAVICTCAAEIELCESVARVLRWSTNTSSCAVSPLSDFTPATATFATSTSFWLGASFCSCVNKTLYCAGASPASQRAAAAFAAAGFA